MIFLESPIPDGNSVKDMLLKHFPYTCILIAAVIGAVICTIFIIKAIDTWKKKIHASEEECKKIEGQIVPRLASIDKSVASIDKSTHALITFLTTKHPDMNIDLFKAHSPIQLTDLGSEILDKIGGKIYIDNNSEYLLNKLAKEPIKSALDVENYSRILLLQEYNTDAFTPIKNYIYQNPVYKNGSAEVTLDTATISNVMGIYLRDKYFEKHPELKNAGA